MTTGTVQYHMRPTIQPVLIALGGVVGVGLVASGGFWALSVFVGGADIANMLTTVTLFLVAVIVLRLLIKLIVLSRTHYTIRNDAFHREYDLLYRTNSREIPVHQLRGHEYSQSRIQSLLGVGTVRLMTAGPNQSLEFIEFEHLRKPEYVREEIRFLVAAEQHE